MPFFIIPNYFHTVTKKCRSQFALILDMTFIFVKLSERFIGLFAKKVCVCGKIENAQTSLIRYTFFQYRDLWKDRLCCPGVSALFD